MHRAPSPSAQTVVTKRRLLDAERDAPPSALTVVMKRLHDLLCDVAMRSRVVVEHASSSTVLMDVPPRAAPTMGGCHAMVWALYPAAGSGGGGSRCRVTCSDAPGAAHDVQAAILFTLATLNRTVNADATAHGPFDAVAAAARLHAALPRATQAHDVRLRYGGRDLVDVATLHGAHDRVVKWVALARATPLASMHVTSKTPAGRGWEPYIVLYLERICRGVA